MAEVVKTVAGLFGKKQWILIGMHAGTLIVAVLVTWVSSKTNGNDLLEFLKWWAPFASGSVTVPAMVADSVRARNGGGKA